MNVLFWLAIVAFIAFIVFEMVRGHDDGGSP
jgi:hypothetical protein